MAWVSRTTRDTNRVGIQQAETGEQIGPGSYRMNCAWGKSRPNFAPFGASDVRSVGIENAMKGLDIVTPGPGTYASSVEVNSIDSRAGVGSVAFRSKTGRFEEGEKGAGAPGPGSYYSGTSFDKANANRKELLRSPSQKNRSAGNVQWARLPTVPSIPTVAQSFGYEEAARGQLKPQKPLNVGHSGTSDDTAGPGEYSPSLQYTSGHRSKGTNFARSKTQRSYGNPSASAAIPGPGAYGNLPPETSQEKQKLKRGTLLKISRRNQEKIKNKPSSTPSPGPGAYTVANSINPAKKPENLQFFGSSVDRFQQPRYEKGPGPGAYGSPVKAFSTSSPKKSALHPNIGFVSSTERFAGRLADEAVKAEPGSYESYSMTEEIKKKVSCRSGTFNTSEARFKYKIPEEIPETEISSQAPLPTSPTKVNASSVFKSSSNRFETKAPSLVPSPGDYDVPIPWEKKGGKGVLCSHDNRFKMSGPSALTAPGPGSYEVAASITRGPPSGETRFRESKILQTPGPGQYNLETIDTQLNRPTYNITIAQEMEQRKQ